MASTFLKVIDVQILTVATKEGVPDRQTRPFLRFELEDGSEFIMSGIPYTIAFNISVELSNRPNTDSRLQIHNLVSELAIVEKVEIDTVVPQTDVYQATLYLTPEGFERGLQYQMIPSHATLLAVLNDAPIYVSDALVKQAESMKS